MIRKVYGKGDIIKANVLLILIPLIYYFIINEINLLAIVTINVILIIHLTLKLNIISSMFMFVFSYLMLNLIPIYIISIKDYLSVFEGDYIWITLGFINAVLATYICIGKIHIRNNQNFESLKRLKEYYLLLLLLLSLLLLIIETYFNGGVSLITREDTKQFGVLARIAKILILISSVYLCVAISKLKNFLSIKHCAVLFFLIITCLVIFFALRTRSYLVAPLFSYMVGVIININLINKKNKLNVKKLIIIFIVATLIISLSVFVRFYRGVFENDGGINNLKYDVMIEKTIYGGDLGYGQNIIDIFEKVEKENLLLYGQSYYRLFFILVPRSIWPEKPENTQQIIGALYPGKSSYYTLPPGIQGDAYINFRYFGLFVGFLFGFIFNFIDRIKSFDSILIMSFFIPIFHLTRGAFTNPIVTIGFLILLYLVIKKINDK